MARHGLDPGAVPVAHAPFTREGGRDAARRLMDEHPETTAILALNDAMATGCSRSCARTGPPCRATCR
ncbi:hypothetical protein NKG05_22550 [Oerskovia sp. M15]